MNKINKNTVLFLGVVVVVCAWLAFGGRHADSDEPIKIGGISALTGVGMAIGEEERRGAALAADEINMEGGILGRKVELISEDLSIDKIKNAVSVAQKLISVDKVVAIIGAQWDEPTIPIIDLLDSYQIPTVGADNSPMLEKDKNYPYYFSAWYDNRVGIRELLRFAKAKNIKRVAIIKLIDAGFWEYTASILQSESKNYNVEIIDVINMGNPLSLDFKTPLIRVISKKPDAIFAVTSDYNQCVFLKQAEQLGYQGITLGTESSGDPVSLAQCPKQMEKRYFSTPKHNNNYQKFAEQYKNKFGEYPRFPSAATAYDAMMTIAEGLKISKLEGGDKLREAIANINHNKGVGLMKISFDEKGYVNTPEDTYEIQTVVGGKFVTVGY